jgi:hypothetical protein
MQPRQPRLQHTKQIRMVQQEAYTEELVRTTTGSGTVI